MTTATVAPAKREVDSFPCGSCGWVGPVVAYHPYAACLIFKATRRDPRPYLRDIGRYYAEHPTELDKT